MVLLSEKSTVNITISLSPVERKKLKQIALDNDVSVSSLIRMWLNDHLKLKEEAQVS